MTPRHVGVRPAGFGVSMLAVLAMMCACSASDGAQSTQTSGSLSDRDRAIATAIARHEAEGSARAVTVASATLGTGTVTDSNTGHQCKSGKLLHIKVTGQWNITHGFASAPVDLKGLRSNDQTLVIAADPATGSACRISYSPRELPPDREATVLFKHWRP